MARLIIRWAEPALEDLDRIADYIALDKPLAARNLVRRVMESVERLTDFPESASKPKELKGTPYRQLVIAPCASSTASRKNRPSSCTSCAVKSSFTWTN
jgi:toxin ParE1/3/4